VKTGPYIFKLDCQMGRWAISRAGGHLCVIFTPKGVGDNVGVGTEVAFYGIWNYAQKQQKC